MSEVIFEAISIVFSFDVLATIFVASAVGIVLGAIPGLTAVMGVALMVPFTFFMDPVPAIAGIASMAAMAIFAGDIPGALLRIPGTPASAAYTEDAYAMTRAGRPERGLGLSMISSTLGGVGGVFLLVFAAPILARFATNFSSVEYFWLAFLGLSCAAIVSNGSALKGVLSLCFGLFIAFIGIDEVAGNARFTFGNVDLMGGVSFIPAMIGMFAMTEILRNSTRRGALREAPKMGPVFAGLWSNIARRKINVIRGWLMGAAVGALPGAGADIAAWVSYAIAKKRSKTPELFGTGHDEGLIEAGASNNSSLSASWVPTLVFGIPGDSITAIVIGVLYLKGLEPGPTIFIKTPEMIYAIFISFLLANLLLLPLGWVVIRLSRYLLRVPLSYLMPMVLFTCIVGSFAINNSLFGVWIMLAFGLVGWFFEENGIPVAPAILGMVLGAMVEFNFVTSMLKSKGDLMVFVERPVATVLALVVVVLWVLPVLRLWIAKASRPA